MMKVNVGIWHSGIVRKDLKFFPVHFSNVLGGAPSGADPESKFLEQTFCKANVPRRKQWESREGGTGKGKRLNQGSISGKVSNSACAFRERQRTLYDDEKVLYQHLSE